jgi:hypothetical protein
MIVAICEGANTVFLKVSITNRCNLHIKISRLRIFSIWLSAFVVVTRLPIPVELRVHNLSGPYTVCFYHQKSQIQV